MTNILVSVWVMSQSYLLFKFFQRLASGDYYIAAFAGFFFYSVNNRNVFIKKEIYASNLR